jgi:hypothetical protein
MFKKKKLLIIGIFFLVLNISFVLSATYRVYSGSNNFVFNANNLEWKIDFWTLGGPSSGNFPRLSIPEAGINLVAPEATWMDDYRADSCGNTPVNGWVTTPCEGWDYWYYPLHYPSMVSLKQTVSPGSYTLNAKSYGSGITDTVLSAVDGGYGCGVFCYIMKVDGSCLHAGKWWRADIYDCHPSPDSCYQYNYWWGWKCNGLWAQIEFYDGTTAIPGVVFNSSAWPIIGDTKESYDGYSVTWLTDRNPQTVEAQQTMKICMDECVASSSGCSVAGTAMWNCVFQAGDCYHKVETACVAPTPYCNGAGTCVECNYQTDCGTDGNLTIYQCNGNWIQQKYRDFSCSANKCSSVDTWLNKTICSSPQVCNPEDPNLSTCCTPNCGSVSSPHECGSNDCGGSCGTCLEPTPNCNEDYTCEGTGLAYWANMNGDKIGDGSSVTHSEIGDSVLLIYKNMGAYINTYNFVISEKDGGSYDTVRTIPASETFNYRGNLAAKWIINSSEFYLKSDGLINKEAEFYFDVNGNKSNELKVNDSSTTPSNSPTVIIKEPVIDSQVRVGNLLNFTQIAKDADDDLKIRWTFEDGDNSEWMYNCLTTGNCNTTHAYDSSGTKIIEIIAREMTRTQEAVNYSQVFAYAPGINVFAVITSPPFGKIFTGLGAVDVFFNASRTYIANCTIGGCNPPCTYDVEDLHCYNLNKTVPTTIPARYNLDFNWTFSEGIGRTGRWYPLDENNYKWVVNFTRLFIAPTAHWAKLRVDYNPKIA